jgi:hypothetical protein
MFELGVLGLDPLELDGDVLVGGDIRAEIDVTEAATSDLTADAVFITYTEFLLNTPCVSISVVNRPTDQTKGS